MNLATKCLLFYATIDSKNILNIRNLQFFLYKSKLFILKTVFICLQIFLDYKQLIQIIFLILPDFITNQMLLWF